MTAPVLGLLACPVAVGAQSPERDDPFDDGDAIVVAGAPGAGSVPTDIPPEIRVERVAIRALGADSLSEVIAAFARQSRSPRSGGDEPIVLLNGRRIGDRREIDELPPEAVLRIEIFPEEVALQYGYPPDRRVVNVILRPLYRAILLQARLELPLGDTPATYGGKAALVRQTPEGRLNLDLGYRRREALADDGAPDPRSRRPRSERGSLIGTWSRELERLSLTATASVERETGDWRLGQDGGNPLARPDVEERAGLGLTLAGKGGRWSWTATGAFDWHGDRATTRDAGGTLSPTAGRSMRGSRREAELELTASGPLRTLPAGEMRATFGGGGSLRRAETRDLWAAGPETAIRQDAAYLSGSIDMPLARNDGAVLFGETRLTAARGDGTLARYGFGLRGTPLPGLSFGASWSDDQALPDFADLAGLPLLAPNTLVYDFATGAAVYAERREGGNPALAPSSTRTLALRLQWKPWAARDLALSFDFTDFAIRNGASGILGATPQVEAAFPERFQRDPTGALTGFDQRPINLAREDRSLLRWGVNWTRPLAPGSQLQLAAFHSWTFSDRAVLRAGQPRVDLLEGAAIGELGGPSRHRIELQLAYAGPDAGLRLTGDWRSATRAEDPALGGHRLHFRPGFDLGLRLYLNLKLLRERAGLGWASGRVYLSFDDLLGGRTRISDEAGNRIDYYRAEDENAGRTVRLSFRKFFY